ncbi:MAG: hypothetical protein IPO85_02185 [Saprospiraceae bacterium]|uniref:Uncharacterized protein n=1 Tax=Candidatus Defluviibacterium haderslevense TaxID=2981993 RepID=A0A9D7S6W6_9BACT|nr:hypothetical protein [Candidatus Defluviibacterium haderslevense]
MYIIAKDYKETNKELTNFIIFFQDKLDYDSRIGYSIQQAIDLDTSKNISILEQKENLIKLQLILVNDLKNIKDKNIAYSPFQFIKYFPKSLCFNFINLNQLNLISENINLISYFNNYKDKITKSNDSIYTMYLARISKNEYQPIFNCHTEYSTQFIINSDTIEASPLGFLKYENKLLKKNKNNVKLKIYNPINNEDIKIFSTIF